jgi:prepilin-type processing-associated H-X9-DG protein
MPILRPAFTIFELLVSIAIIAILIGLLLPAVQKIREAANRCTCQSSMKQLAMAVHAYHDQFSYFPPARDDPGFFTDRRGWMWRLLPFIDQKDLQDYTLDDVSFMVFSGNAIPLLLCPSDPRDLVTGFSGTSWAETGTFGMTSYCGVVGTTMNCDATPTNGAFDTSLAKGIRLLDVRDGASTTLMIGERPPSPELYWGWWAFSDYDNLMATQSNVPIYGPCPGPNVYGPGEYEDPCASTHFWSPHRDGGNWAFVDGSVRWIGYRGAAATIPLSTRAGGEVVDTACY